MLVLMGGVELPVRAIREQIASAFDLIVHLVRLVDGSRRINRITEVAGLEGDVVTLQDLFVARSPEDGIVANRKYALLGPLRSTGLMPNFLPKLATSGVDLPPNVFQESFE
jgi:pilus assembly protein CpaF